jgi:murein DD-endopeptidase MepM/ murein hydrolase activator NlpD
VRGRNSFGEPVFSIGHGLVTYAEPEGWNRDKGVIIIRHRFADGSEFLSFYGHLDPPSILLEPGDCVERGQQIAQIGRPRSSPHLHFEIRTQAPYQTLTGYWPEDPTLVGWLPPSAVIWRQRISASPGVLWALPNSLPYAFEDVEYVGLYDETLITIQSQLLTGTSIQDGRHLWQLENEESMRVYGALIDNRFPIVYSANRSGQIEAHSLLNNQVDSSHPSLQLLWSLELDIFGQTDLLPLPGGGLLVAANDQFLAFNPEGTLLWERESVGDLSTWAMLNDNLVLAIGGEDGFWGTADASGIEIWDDQGIPDFSVLVAAGDRLWLYNRDGLYRFDWETKTADLHYPLARGLSYLGDIVGLPDGGVLLAHADTADRRLLAFNPDGSLRWERSYDETITGAVRLVEQDGGIYLTDDQTGTSNGVLSLYTLDLNNAALTEIFAGGSRSNSPGDSWVEAAENHLIINIAGGNLLALDPLQLQQ